jgi:hypothetical protein
LIGPPVLAAALAAAAPAAAAPAFTVSYSGSGRWATSYHSQPSDGGGKHDTNTASDSSTQGWHETFTTGLGPGRHTGELSGARGRSSASGRIDHVHIDGLYTQLNASERCTVHASTPVTMPLHAVLKLRYTRDALAVTALNPIDDVLTLLPTACPGQGDALDGLANNYFEPGFSFAPQWGSDHWFTSSTAKIPLARLRRARTISVRLRNTRAGTPPRDCSVPDPSSQQCRTGGAWSATLTLRAAPR